MYGDRAETAQCCCELRDLGLLKYFSLKNATVLVVDLLNTRTELADSVYKYVFKYRNAV